eukprot:scaffold900_cov430-Prasinococcus_capsulatus_cf.AAC.3
MRARAKLQEGGAALLPAPVLGAAAPETTWEQRWSRLTPSRGGAGPRGRYTGMWTYRIQPAVAARLRPPESTARRSRWQPPSQGISGMGSIWERMETRGRPC